MTPLHARAGPATRAVPASRRPQVRSAALAVLALVLLSGCAAGPGNSTASFAEGATSPAASGPLATTGATTATSSASASTATSSTPASSSPSSSDIGADTTRITIEGGTIDERALLPFDAAARHAQPYFDANGRTHPGYVTAFDQLTQWAGSTHTLSVQDSSYGFMLQQIDGQPPVGTQAFWRLVVNGEDAEVGMDTQRVAGGDDVAWILTPY